MTVFSAFSLKVRESKENFDLELRLKFKGFQMVGHIGDVQRRSCPTSYGNSDKWSGDPVKCVPMASPDRSTGILDKSEYCPGM